MELSGCVALVTGANRGLGKAFAAALLRAGAAKVYGGARDPDSIADPRIVPVRLDVTAPDQVDAAAARCADVMLVINNAGIHEAGSLLGGDAPHAFQRQIAVNALGPLLLARAFAPVIRGNGGGTIATMLSVTSWFTTGQSPAYCASKHAALALNDGLRMELAPQGVRVMGIYAGFIDTDMVASVDRPKVSPESVAEETIQGLAEDRDHLFADARSVQVWRAVRDDPYAFMASLPRPDPEAAA